MDILEITPHACAATGCNHSSHVAPMLREAVMKLDALFLTGTRLVSKDEFVNALGLIPLDGETLPEDAAESWVDVELLLAAILVAALLRVERDIAGPRLRPYFTGPGEAFDIGGLRNAMFEVAQEIKDEITRLDGPLRSEVAQAVDEAFERGETRIARGILTNTQSTPVVKDAITTSTLRYVGEFFEKFGIPTIERRVLNALATPLPEASAARPDLLPLGQIITDTFDAQGDAYARMVANAAISRTYHYALTKAGTLQGYTLARFSAVLDNKTSEICESLAGRTYSLAAIVSKYEAAAMAQTTDELKAISPWYQQDSALSRQDNTRRYLSLVGVPVPPLHGNCRSTLVLM